ncbi:hypothetical protein [Streptomyces sp. NPDC059063]|uniref:hypothetical protein n=1 Tax=unclassified Streptomyces TaxID=2593676 RepID=UPI0036C1EB24
MPPLLPGDDLASNRPGESLRKLLAAEGPTSAQRVVNWLLRRTTDGRKSETEAHRVQAVLERYVGFPVHVEPVLVLAAVGAR